MRRFLTIGITGKGEVEILHGADKDKREHVDEFNKLAKAAKGKKAKKSKFAEVQVIDLSRGIVKRKRHGNVEGSGKRTIARTVKKRAKKAAEKSAKKSARKKRVAKASAGRSARGKKAAVTTPPAPKQDEGLFPGAKPEGE
jgi:hypothetical protein